VHFYIVNADKKVYEILKQIKMEIKSSIVHRFFVAIMTMILFLAVGLYSCVNAQSSVIENQAVNVVHTTIQHSAPCYGEVKCNC